MSNMVTSIRDYFKGIVQAIDSDLEFDGFVFAERNIADHDLDYSYKLNVGRMGIQREDSDIISQFPVTIEIYRVSSHDRQEEDFENTYCKAIDIAARSMNQTLIDQTDWIKSVVATSINPTPIENNDTTMVFTLQFNVTVTFKYKLD